MLERYAARLGEIAHDIEGGSGVLDIVIGHLFALQLLGRGEREGNGLLSSVELGLLVGVLAITERLLEVVFEEQLLVEAGLLAHIGSDAAVVLGGVGIRLSGELQAGVKRGVAAFANLGKHTIVVRRVANDSNIVVVLGRRAEHRGTAYVDLLDGFCHRSALFGDGLAERIEIDADQVDELNAVLTECLQVARHIAACQQSTMHLGVEGLDTTIADFGETRHLGDTDGGDTCLLEKTPGTAGGDDVPTTLFQTLYEGNESRLVAYAN